MPSSLEKTEAEGEPCCSKNMACQFLCCVYNEKVQGRKEEID